MRSTLGYVRFMVLSIYSGTVVYLMQFKIIALNSSFLACFTYMHALDIIISIQPLILPFHTMPRLCIANVKVRSAIKSRHLILNPLLHKVLALLPITNTGTSVLTHFIRINEYCNCCISHGPTRNTLYCGVPES